MVTPEEADRERELEALLTLSEQSRDKLDRLRDILTSPGHYGKGATPFDVVYRENPTKEQMPKGLEHVGTHMFGPDVLLAGWPEGKGK